MPQPALVMVAGLFLALGATAFALHGAIARGRDWTLVALGAFVTLYGLRMLVWVSIGGGWNDSPLRYIESGITYVIPLPVLWYMARQAPPRLAWLARALGALQAALAVLGLAFEAAAGRPGAAGPVNNLLVLAFFPLVSLQAAWAWRTRDPAHRPTVGIVAGLAVFFAFGLAENLRPFGLLPGWPDRAEPIGLLVLTGTVAYALTMRAASEQQRLAAIDQELLLARRIQTSLLPRHAPQLPGAALAVRYLPMTAVAGDIYDFFVHGPRTITVLVSDVSGHGVPAALVASMVKVAAAALADTLPDPGDALSRLNRTLSPQLDGPFVTCACLHVDLEARRFRYAGAGHPPLLRCSADGVVEAILSNGPLIGPLPGAEYPVHEGALQGGERFLLYTDGVVEAADPHDELFGQDQLAALLVGQLGADAETTATAVVDALRRWRAPATTFDDDVTLVVIDILR